MNAGAWSQNIDTMFNDLRLNYSDAKDAAIAIEALPDDAIIFENSEDYCCAVIPYLKNKKIYNPFAKSVASYINRNPALIHSMSYDEFVLTCREMFPDINLNKIFILKSTEVNYIDGLKLDDENFYKAEYPTVRGESFEIYYINL